MTTDELQTKEKELDVLALEIYAASQREITFMFPLVLVRVLPKEQMRGSIIAPGIEQNKPLYEGVVLATWGEKVFERTKIDPDAGKKYTKRQVMTSDLKPGDHVVFPHWTGAPLHGLDDQRYRVIKEWGWEFEKDGGIYAIVNHNVPDETPRELLIDILMDIFSVHYSEAIIRTAASLIEDRMLLIDRDKSSVTLSGR